MIRVLLIICLLAPFITSSQERITNIKSGISDSKHQLLHYDGQDYYIQYYSDGAFDVFEITEEGEAVLKHSNTLIGFSFFQEFSVLDHYLVILKINEIEYYDFINNVFFKIELPADYSLVNVSAEREHPDYICVILWNRITQLQDKAMVLKKDMSFLELNGLNIRVEDISSKYIHTSYSNNEGYAQHEFIDLNNGTSSHIAAIGQAFNLPIGMGDDSWWGIRDNSMLVKKDYDNNELSSYQLPFSDPLKDIHVTAKYLILELLPDSENQSTIHIFDKDQEKLVRELNVQGGLTFSERVPKSYGDKLILNSGFSRLIFLDVENNKRREFEFLTFLMHRVEISEDGDIILPTTSNIINFNLNTFNFKKLHQLSETHLSSFGSKKSNGRLLYYFGNVLSSSNRLHQFDIQNQDSRFIEVPDITDKGLEQNAQIYIYDIPYVISNGNLFAITEDGEVKLNGENTTVARNSIKYQEESIYFVESDGFMDKLIRLEEDMDKTVITEIPPIFMIHDFYVIGSYLLFYRCTRRML